MLLEVFVLMGVVAFAFIVLGYSIDTTFFSIFGFAILFFLGVQLLGLNEDDGILIPTGSESDVTFNYDSNDTLVSENKVSNTEYDTFSHWLFGLVMTFVSLVGILDVLFNLRRIEKIGGFNDA